MERGETTEVPALIEHKYDKTTRSVGIVLLCFLLGVAGGCSSATSTGRVTFNYIDYNRGASFPSHSDVDIITPAGETRFHDVQLEGKSFFEDNSIIPHAFVKPLLHGKFGDALNAFTEPYYGYRFHHFFKSRPEWGFGVEFTHLKVSIADRQQSVSVTGPWPGVSPDGQVIVGDQFAVFDVSHGVNHVALSGVRRWVLLPSTMAPDGRLQPFVTVGAGPAVPHLELTINQDGEGQRKAYSYNLRRGNWGLESGTGLRWKISPHFGAYGEYKWSYSILNNMRFDNGEEGRVRMRFSSHHLMWGLSYGF